MALTPLRGNNPPNVNSVLQSNPGDRVTADKSAVSPIVAVMSRQMPLPQAQQLAGQTALVRVAKSGPGDQAELEFQGQNIQVKLPPGKTLTAGDMITVAFALGDKAETAGGEKTGGPKKTLDVSNLLLADSPEGEEEGQKSPSFVDKLSSSARLIGLLERLGQPKGGQSTAIASQSRPMAQLMSTDAILDMVDMDGNPIEGGFKFADMAGMDKAGQQGAKQAAMQAAQGAPLPGEAEAAGKATDPRAAAKNSFINPNQNLQGAAKLDPAMASRQLSGLLAQQVSQAVENSGLFYESHLQQWANGERSKAQLFQEPQSRFGAEQVISEKTLDPGALNNSVRMVAQQLSTLDQSRVQVAMHGLFQHPVELEIKPDPEHNPQQQQGGGEEETRPWVANLKLDMPSLGPLKVRLRMVGQRLDLQISGDRNAKGTIDQNWSEFREALEGKGLTLTHGQVRISEDLSGASDG